ncbi:MAG: ComEC/Rec2 family competence protein, partial [bacterium]|nr:ComEC/Rec2 family competence protein [bacterium]
MLIRPDTLFFYAVCGFVAGAILGGLDVSPTYAIFISAIFVFVFFLWKIPPVIIFTVIGLFLAGNIYYAIDDYAYHKTLIEMEESVHFDGVVIDEPRRSLEAQTAKVKLVGAGVENTVSARIYLRVDLYPEISYGDVVRIYGDIVPPPRDSYGNYLKKENIHGTAFYPKIEIIGNEGNIIFNALFNVRRYIKETLGILFTQQQAAFLSGVMLGDRDEFSKEFLNKLSISGTMHLTALSGLHMTILIFLALAVFSAVFVGKRHTAFYATFVTIALFVAMTGFKVSAIRASLMAFLVGFSKQSSRTYSPRNAIALAASVITAWNPKAPVFDLGFQLSFIATLAIIYGAPVIKRIPFFNTSGFLAWRDVLSITLAAQLSVLPITIAYFANFSLSAFPANIAILIIMPTLMAFGFLTAAVSIIYMPFAELLSRPTAFLTDYAINVVEVFSSVRGMFNPELGVIGTVLYYAVLIWICWRYSPVLKH